MAGPSSCPRCGGSMEQGFVLDESYAARKVAKWVEGAPEHRIWNLKLRGKRQLEITACRCSKCGFLESYARD